jgi:hypothetical protein
MRAESSDFFPPWKDADPDVPTLNEAKAQHLRIDSLAALARRIARMLFSSVGAVPPHSA